MATDLTDQIRNIIIVIFLLVIAISALNLIHNFKPTDSTQNIINFLPSFIVWDTNISIILLVLALIIIFISFKLNSNPGYSNPL